MITFYLANNQIAVYGTAERAVKELDGSVKMFDQNGTLVGERVWEDGDSVSGNFEVVEPEQVPAIEPVAPDPPIVVVTTVPATATVTVTNVLSPASLEAPAEPVVAEPIPNTALPIGPETKIELEVHT